MLNIRNILHDSIVDGPGIRSVVFTQGCKHACVGCHNPKLMEVNDKYLMSVEDIIKDIEANNFTQKVTLSGGEPMLQEGIVKLAKELKTLNYHIVMFSGYTLEQIEKLDNAEILDIIDVLIDGKFEISLRELDGGFKGSSNQIVHELKS